MAKKLDLDIQRLRDRLRYEPETGQFFWKTHQQPAAGFIGNRGYVRIKFDGREWLAHVLAWAYSYGAVLDVFEIDHINRNPADNRLTNLRAVTHAENMANSGATKVRSVFGKPLPPNVSYSRRERKFKASFSRGGRKFHVGTFATADDAAAALAKAKAQGTQS